MWHATTARRLMWTKLWARSAAAIHPDFTCHVLQRPFIRTCNLACTAAHPNTSSSVHSSTLMLVASVMLFERNILLHIYQTTRGLGKGLPLSGRVHALGSLQACLSTLTGLQPSACQTYCLAISNVFHSHNSSLPSTPSIHHFPDDLRGLQHLGWRLIRQVLIPPRGLPHQRGVRARSTSMQLPTWLYSPKRDDVCPIW